MNDFLLFLFERKLFTFYLNNICKKKAMKTIQIKQIRFNNFNDRVCCKGNVTINHLSLESSIEFNYSALNQMLGLLNREFEISVNELIQEEKIDEAVYYTIDFRNEALPIVDLGLINTTGNWPLKISA